MASHIQQGLKELKDFFEAREAWDNFEPLEDKIYLNIILNIKNHINQLETEMRILTSTDK